MQALVKSRAEPGLWLCDVAMPTLGPNDLLVKIRKTAICGTDLHVYNWDAWASKTIGVPRVMGHEFVGEVVAMGDAVTGYRTGARVSGEGHITCGHCRNCRAGRRHLCRNAVGIGIHRDGAFAEYLCLPAENAFPIPDDIDDDLAAIFDPFGNATHTALSFDLVGEDVLITGAGPIGIMGAAICKHVGARQVVITDVNDYRLELARTIGATRTVNPQHENLNNVMKELGMTEGFDVGLEMSGNASAFQSLLKTMNWGGRVAILGLFSENVGIDWSQVIFKGLTLKGIYGREMYETWYKMMCMLQSGLDLRPVVTHHYPAAEFERGFEVMRSGLAAKVILEW